VAGKNVFRGGTMGASVVLKNQKAQAALANLRLLFGKRQLPITA
jgi:hypothetical protein